MGVSTLSSQHTERVYIIAPGTSAEKTVLGSNNVQVELSSKLNFITKQYLPEDDSKRPYVGLGGISMTAKDLWSGPLDPDMFLSFRNELVVDHSTSSLEISEMNNEIGADVEAVCRQLAVHDKPVNKDTQMFVDYFIIQVNTVTTATASRETSLK